MEEQHSLSLYRGLSNLNKYTQDLRRVSNTFKLF